MSLIHTCYFAGVDPRDYLTQVQRHEQQVQAEPARWLPWNYREQLAQPCPAAKRSAEPALNCLIPSSSRGLAALGRISNIRRLYRLCCFSTLRSIVRRLYRSPQQGIPSCRVVFRHVPIVRRSVVCVSGCFPGCWCSS
jgi:hypothetical protein